MPYRIAAPPAPEPPEVEHPYAAELRAQRRRARILVSAAVVIAVAGGAAKVARSGQAPRGTTSEARVKHVKRGVEGARDAVDGAQRNARLAQNRFELGVRDAIGQDLRPRPDLGSCPVALPAASSLIAGRAAFPLLTIERAEIGEPLPSQAVAAVLVDVRRAEAHLASGRFEEATLYGRALARPGRLGYEIVLFARASKRPRALSGSVYEPGEVEGRAYLYDFASDRVLCAGDVRAKSSKAIGYAFSDRVDAPVALGPIASMGEAIHEDIRLQTERAIVDAVQWRAGPPLRED